MDEARSTYEQGLDGSPVLCLSAIPLGEGTDPDAVLGELAGGATFADTAAKYSSDPTLAQSGGRVVDQDGNNCLSNAGFNPDLLTLLADEGAAPGSPWSSTWALVPSSCNSVRSTTSDQNEKATLVLDKVGADVRDRLQATEIYVNPRYGRWDPEAVAVVPLGNG